MLLLTTSNFSGYGLHHIFKIVKKSGYDGIDLSIEHNNYDYWDKMYVKQLIDEYQLPVVSLCAPDSKLSVEKVDLLIEISEHIGAKMIRFSPPRITDKDTGWFKNYLPKKQKETKVLLSVQNVPPKFFLFVIPEYKNSTLDQVKHLTGSVSFDISGVDLASGVDMIRAEEILGSAIKSVILSDKKGEKEGLLPGMSTGDVSHLPIESLLIKMKGHKYTGDFILKVNSGEIHVGSEEKMLLALSKFKEYFDKHFTNYK